MIKPRIYIVVGDVGLSFRTQRYLDLLRGEERLTALPLVTTPPQSVWDELERAVSASPLPLITIDSLTSAFRDTGYEDERLSPPGTPGSPRYRGPPHLKAPPWHRRGKGKR